MQVGGNGIRNKALLNGRNRLKERKASSSVSYVKNDAPFASFKQIRQNFALRVQHGYISQILMRIDIARTKVLQNKILKRAFRPELGEVDHYGDVRELPGFDTPVHRNPLRTRIVGDFNSDDDVLVPLCHLSGLCRIHILRVLLHIKTSTHAAADNVE